MTPVRRLHARSWSRQGALLLGLLVAACESPVAPTACGLLPQVTAHAGETASVTACFNDANGDALGYTVASSNPSVATASLAGSVVSVDAVAPGNATITVTATDAGGLKGQASFGVVVPNRPPRARASIPAQRVEAGSEVVVDLASWFEDPDGQSLAYRVVPSDAEIVEVALSGARATLAGLAKGVADITATATDPGGLAAAQTFGFEVPDLFEIEIRFATAMSASHRAAFESAQARWMAILADTELPELPVPEGVVEVQVGGRTYEESVSVIDDLMIVAAVAEIDGVAGALGHAGIRGLREELRLPWLGVMELDAADLDGMEANGTLEAVILHEMGHVLGIGTLWRSLDLLRNPSVDAGREVDTHLPLPFAVEAFDQAGGLAYTEGGKVPVENKGTSPGSDDGHWRKNVFANELMTESISPGSSPLSAVTVASLADLGYAVRMDLAEAYRLPGAAALLEHRRRAIPLGDDVIRMPMEVRDGNGRVVGVIPP